MTLFNPDNRGRSAAHKRLYTYCEMAYTIVDFPVAALFVIGSILFFQAATTFVGTWLFLIGSILVGLGPKIQLYREMMFLRMKDYNGITGG